MTTPEPSPRDCCGPKALSLMAVTRTLTTDGSTRLTISAVLEWGASRPLCERSTPGDASEASAARAGDTDGASRVSLQATRMTKERPAAISVLGLIASGYGRPEGNR